MVLEIQGNKEMSWASSSLPAAAPWWPGAIPAGRGIAHLSLGLWLEAANLGPEQASPSRWHVFFLTLRALIVPLWKHLNPDFFSSSTSVFFFLALLRHVNPGQGCSFAWHPITHVLRATTASILNPAWYFSAGSIPQDKACWACTTQAARCRQPQCSPSFPVAAGWQLQMPCLFVPGHLPGGRWWDGNSPNRLFLLQFSIICILAAAESRADPPWGCSLNFWWSLLSAVRVMLLMP